jgi:DNA-binding Lrp family transcriptional regulator
MDKLDSTIISELQKNLRQSNRRIAQSLGVDEHTIKKRIENLVSSGAIILAALPNLKRLGYQNHVFMILEVTTSILDDVGKKLCQLPQLGYVGYCAGFSKFYVRGDFPTLESLSKFIKEDLGKISGINSFEIIIELQQLKSLSTELTGKSVTRFSDTSLSPKRNKTIDDLNRRLILELQKNARAPLKELANIVGVSPMTIQRHIKYLVENETVDFTAIPNNGTLGYPVIAFVRIQTDPATIGHAAESFAKYSQIHYVGITAGPTQILVTLHGQSHQEISELIKSELSVISGVVGIESFVFLVTLKQTYTWIQDL